MWIKQNHTALRTRASDAELNTLRIEIEPTVVTTKFTKDLTTEHNWFVYLCAFFDQNLVGAKFLAICQSWHCSNISYKQFFYINMNFNIYIYSVCIYTYSIYPGCWVALQKYRFGGFLCRSRWRLLDSEAMWTAKVAMVYPAGWFLENPLKMKNEHGFYIKPIWFLMNIS